MQGTSQKMSSQTPGHDILETVPLWCNSSACWGQFAQVSQYIQVDLLYLHHGNHEDNNSELHHILHIQNPENCIII